MKNLIIILLALAGVLPATAQNIKMDGGRVSLENVEVTQRHDTVLVNFDVVAAARYFSAREAMVITPRVDSRAMPSMLVGGGRKMQSIIREEALSGVRRDIEFKMRSGRIGAASKHYTCEFYLTDDIAGHTFDIEFFTENCCVRSDVHRFALTVEPLAHRADGSAPSVRVQWLEPEEEAVKRREESLTVNLTYPQGVSDVRRNFGDNETELARIDRALRPLFSGGTHHVDRVKIDGYASIEGQWNTNEKLSKERGEGFQRWLYTNYGSLGDVQVETKGEDWDGLLRLIRADGAMPGQWEAIDIIERVGIFDGREKLLMDLREGVPYRYMYRYFFPQLRRMEVTFGYEVGAVDGTRAQEMLYERPGDLSHAEMLRTLRQQGMNELDMYREVANLRPNDVVAQINAANAEMEAGDLSKAWGYLRLAKDDERAANAVALYNQLSQPQTGGTYTYKIVDGGF